MPDFSLENSLYEKGFELVCGVDEAGRGPLAGPVCAAAVILPRGYVIDGLDDSKKLSEKKREKLYDVITENAVSYCVAFGSVEEIEKFNILQATFMAMTRAVNGLKIRPDFVLVDGNRKPPEILLPCDTVIKGDSKSYSVAAASVLAKVTRDRLLYDYDREYPQYGFAKHKGYGTKAHYEAIAQYGITPVHRPSFLKNVL